MRKVQTFATLFVTVSTIIGCSGGGGSTPAAPKPHFNLSNESHKQLNDVDCRATDQSIVCDEVTELYGIKDMSWKKRDLEQKKLATEKRIKAVDAVYVELQEAQKKEWSAETTKTLNNYSSLLFLIKTRLPTELEKITNEISQEEKFQDIKGYSCSGKYGIEEADLEFSQSLNLIDKKDDAKTDEVDQTVIVNNKSKKEIEAKVTYQSKGKEFRLRVGNDGTGKKLSEVKVMSIWMNGEFSVDLSGGPYKAEANCFRKTALNANPTEVTQRITERARLACVSMGIIPKKGAADNNDVDFFQLGNIESNYGIDDKSENVFMEMASSMQQSFGDNPLKKAGVKYLFDVSTNAGEVTFSLTNIENNQLIATIKTRNSSDKISLNYLNKGYGARIDCSVPTK